MKKLSLAGLKALEALNRVFRENDLPEVTSFEEVPSRVTELLTKWLGNNPTRIERVGGKEEVLVLGEDQVKTRIARISDLMPTVGIEPEESEFGDDETKVDP